MATEAQWKKSLNKHHQELRTGILVGNFLPALHNLPLTEIEYSKIDGKTDNTSRVDALMRILLTKEQEHFNVFCTVLRKNGYAPWADRLIGEDIYIAIPRQYVAID